MKVLFISLLNMSIVASWLIVAVILFRLIFKKAPKWIVALLWCLVGFRLLCPFSIQAPFSLIPSTNTFIVDSNNVTMDTGINNMDSALNAYLMQSYNETNGTTVSFGEKLITSSTATVLLYIWIAGIIFLVIGSLISYIRLKGKLNDAVRYEGNIYQTDRISSPFVFGIIRPRIYIPYSLESDQMECVILHEQAHIKRRDHIIKPVGYLLLSVYWFNPLVWVAFIMLCRDIELACDERVIREMGLDKKRLYSETLLKCSIPQSMLLSCPVAFAEVSVKERIVNIMKIKKTNKLFVLGAILVALAVVAVFTTNPVKASTDDKEEPVVIHLSSPIVNLNDTANSAENTVTENVSKTQDITSLGVSEPTNIVADTTVDKDMSNESVAESGNVSGDATSVTETPAMAEVPAGPETPSVGTPSVTVDDSTTTDTSTNPDNTTASENTTTLKTPAAQEVSTPTTSVPKIILPVSGNAVLTHGFDSDHQATDYSAPTGTPLVASISGTVTATGFDEANGNYLVITSADGWSVYYNNCDSITVSVNSTVNAGDTVATLGSTGNSTGPHLHFAVSDAKGTFYDPTTMY